MRLLTSLSLVLAIVGAASVATAQQRPDNKQAAQSRAQLAELEYNLGNFEKALTGYSEAYAIFPAGGLLFNIGQCHRYLKNFEKAIFFFEGYLRETPNAPNRKLVEEMIRESRRNLKKAEAAEEAERARATAEADRKRAEADRQRAEEERKRAEAEQKSAELGLISPQPGSAGNTDSSPAFYEKWWFWAAVSGVVVIGATATLVVLSDGSTTLPAGSLGTHDAR